MNLIGNLNALISILVFILASTFALFLYFRTGRHELVDDEILFDSAIVGAIGALIGGRVVDFLLRSDFYGFSISKLFFFNVYHGFDWYGAILGAVVAIYILLKKKQVNFWFVLDIIGAPVVFAAILISVSNFFLFGGYVPIIYAVVLTVVFWVLKRLAKIKRNHGFFFSLTLILLSLLEISLFPFKEAKYRIFGQIEYTLVMPALVLAVGLVLFYTHCGRKIKADIQNLAGLFLLGLFKFRRILTSSGEANLVARSILLSPLHLSKFILNLVKLLGTEIGKSFFELLQVFRFKR
ncbi:MAG: hypothetical protein UU34_C0008G0042 [Candidatus Curtissbacteria bacterium GW2011_GWA1_41_11]|uniref:Prolipoprotein diacylglyceryl transferase n=1 Tax=Candidatus Curtissbacteria bacterium GW2011_GWA1_41_11 TaxID=1618409 RepID=A0A0G0UDI9_9BACT|nr:MAG: hypothetical protein UU34_C0008G0042 [Candidatus Curtissbacteria bacterium GW2011_GWA1_41_11]